MIFTSTQYLYNSHRSFEFLVYTDYTNIFYLVKEESGLFCEHFVNIFHLFGNRRFAAKIESFALTVSNENVLVV